MSSFTERLLRASFVLPQGVFSGTTSNTLVLEGLRMTATITGASQYPSSCSLRVNGLRAADMNALSVIWAPTAQFAPGVPLAGVATTPINALARLILEAQPDSGGWLQIFGGTFTEGGPDYTQLPDVAFYCECKTGYIWQVQKATPLSINGSASVVNLAKQLASQMGYPLENNGVAGVLHNPYFAGTLMDQWIALAAAAPFDWYLEGRGVLAICPRNTPRERPVAKVLNASSGLVGYPQVQRYGVQVSCLFDPMIELGSPIQIGGNTNTPGPVVGNKRLLGLDPQAGGLPYGTEGLWFPYSATHTLSSLMPGGPWFSQLSCMPTQAAAAAQASS